MDNARLLERIESGELQIDDEFDGVKIAVELEAVDQLAMLLRRIALDSPSHRGSLQNQARAVVEKLTYLGGSLRIVEVDGVSNAAQIRSVNPEKDGYVEVVLRGGNHVSLERRPAGSVHLSKPNFARLVADLGEILER
jgi:hypothetical protein